MLFCITLHSYGQSTAIYDVVFTSNWEAHGPLPGANAHFTNLVGATHNSDISFFQNGGIATLGVEGVAETGNDRNFRAEVNTAINARSAEQYINGPDLFFNGPGRTITISDLSVSSDFPLISLISMIAPSPDWIIGVNSIPLLNDNDQWITTISMDIFPYDAGTEEGTGYSINNPATAPKEPMTSLRGITPFLTQPIGSLVFTLKSVDDGGTKDCTGEISSFPANESFETSLGNWSNTTTGDDIDWSRDSEGTPSSGTGPSTGADGNLYLYVEASGNGTGFPNKQAILNSPCLNFSNLTSPTLNFSYHMYGSAINNLRVEIRNSNSSDWINVFNRDGDQGDTWNEANLDLSNYAGQDEVQIRFIAVTGSGTSGWQSDIAIDALSILNDTVVDPDPNPSCEALNMNNFSINGFSNQDNAGNFSINNEGSSLTLTNNTWKFIPMNYIVTENTILEFDFSSTSEGEIHGIGFEDDNELSPDRYFKVYGTQNYGLLNYDNYASGTTSYVIPVGNFYTGAINRLVFINDNDAGAGNNAVFTNIKIHEGDCSRTAQNFTSNTILPILGASKEGLSKITISPNPAKDTFVVTSDITTNKKNEITMTIYSIYGNAVTSPIKITSKMSNISTSNLSLKPGMYLIKFEGKDIDNETVTQRLIIK